MFSQDHENWQAQQIQALHDRIEYLEERHQDMLKKELEHLRKISKLEDELRIHLYRLEAL